MLPREKKRLREILAALRAKTTANGCTEAEALAAAEKVSELMTAHAVDGEALEFEEKKMRANARRSVIDPLWVYVGLFCNCINWMSRNRWDGRRSVVYFGRWNDVEIAEYLHDVMVRHVATATRAFRKSVEYTHRRTTKTRSAVLRAFQEGLIQGLIGKLQNLQWKRFSHVQESNRQAVILQPLAAVEDELARRGLVIKELKPLKSASRNFGSAWLSGHAAAKSIDLNAAVKNRHSPAGLLGEA